MTYNTPEIVYHGTLEDGRAAWAWLEANGGYTLFIDATRLTHALPLGVTSRHGIRGDG